MCTHNKFNSVRVGEIESLLFVYLTGFGQFEWFGFGSAGKFLAAGQLDLSPHYPTISELVLFTSFVVGDEKMNMVEDVRGTFLT